MTHAQIIPWPIIADEDYALSKQLGAAVWPATLVVGTDGVVAAHVSGAPLSLTVDVQAQLDFLAGKINRNALTQRLASTAVVSDGPVQKAQWHLQMARKLMSEGKIAEASTLFADGLRLQPDSAPLRVGLINTLLQSGKANEAAQELEKLPENAVPSWQVELMRAQLDMLRGRRIAARQRLTVVLKQQPDSAEAHYLMGQIHEEQKDWQKAAEEYRAAGRRQNSP